jgi:hypothetical protein
VALKREEIFGQFLSLIRDEIRAAIAPKRSFLVEQILIIRHIPDICYLFSIGSEVPIAVNASAAKQSPSVASS